MWIKIGFASALSSAEINESRKGVGDKYLLFFIYISISRF